MRNFFTRAVVTASTLVSFANALPTISVKGSKLFANGQQFFIKGFAYQGTPDDPLVDANQCKIDAAAMKTFGTNSIRVYHVDPTANHDDCMSIFEDAGIYIWLDLDTFTTQIEQTGPQWTKEQFYAFATVMDIFSSYSNLAGFWIGNEVITSNTGSPAAPYIKAAVTDIKAYMAAKKYRTFPIGYSAADIAELRPALQNYLVCGGEETAIDFYGINSYEWCGDSSYETSGYANLEAQAANYSVPIFFSETGCIVARPRLFTDQAAIFGPNMVDTFSGSIIYEWVEEVNDYGVVSYPGGGAKGTPTPIQPDYDNLMKQWKAINPAGVKEADYKPQFSAPPCPASAAGGWQVNGNVPIPTLGADVVKAALNRPAGSGAHPSVPPPPPVSVLSTHISSPSSTSSPSKSGDESSPSKSPSSPSGSPSGSAALATTQASTSAGPAPTTSQASDNDNGNAGERIVASGFAAVIAAVGVLAIAL